MSGSHPFAGTVHASVPVHEHDWAQRALPGSTILQGPPGSCPLGVRSEARILSVSSQDRLDGSLLEEWPGLEAVVTRSTGCDRLPLAELEKRGVEAFHLDGYATKSVAQHTLMFLLMLLRRVPEATTMTRGRSRTQGKPVWDRSRLQGRNLDEVTVGVLGTGRIGSRVVRLLSGLGAKTVGYDIAPDASLCEVAGFRYSDSFEGLLAASDALTVHVPLTDKTRSMIDQAALQRLPRGAVLLNTARGEVVDQRAVIEALESGALAGYAADVLPGEPDPPGLARFQDRDRVVLTPHLAAYDAHALRARYETTASVIRSFFAGDPQGLQPHRPVLE